MTNEPPPLIEFVHPPLGEEVEAASGRYQFLKGGRIEVGGRSVLYFVGVGIFDSSCCGSGGCGYALVPGFVAGPDQTRDGRTVTPVEPVLDENDRREIEDAIKALETVSQVNFPIRQY